MEQVLLIILIPSFLAFWIVVVLFYTPSCFRLRAMIDLIDQDGVLKEDKIKWSIGGNLHTVDNWLISIPTSAKYLKYNEVTMTVDKIRTYRRIIGILTPVLVVTGFILLTTTDQIQKRQVDTVDNKVTVDANGLQQSAYFIAGALCFVEVLFLNLVCKVG